MIDKQPCGCRHNGTEWVFMCEACRAEHDETHERWGEEHRAAESAKRFKELM